jgi:monoamine oxidase
MADDTPVCMGRASSILNAPARRNVRREMRRRNFLKKSALALAALSAPPLEALTAVSEKLVKAPARRKRVIVLGAGLAGLSAAYQLARAGHDVTILEARARAGGRIHTLREPFAEGLHAEAGAMFIPESHTLVMQYIRRFRLPLVPVPTAQRLPVYYLRGRRINLRQTRDINWPLDLSPEEKELGLAGMTEKYVIRVLREMGDAASVHWPPAELKKYDRMTYGEFLRSRGASDDAVRLLRLNDADLTGDGVDRVSALMVLREAALNLNSGRLYTIRGGTDLLPKALAAHLAQKILYGAPVVRLEQDALGVRATYLQANAYETVSADYLVCTLPFSLLKEIEVTPQFSHAKQRAIRELPYTSAARVYLQSRREFWMDEGLGISAYTDLPIMAIVNSTLNQRGRRGILDIYAAGAQARQVTEMRESERLSFALREVEKVYPGIRKNFEGGTSVCWDEDRWARGAYAWFKPGQMSDLLPHIARSEGRIHFAGEHTSSWPGWMQGAVQSGHRAAREINEAL